MLNILHNISDIIIDYVLYYKEKWIWIIIKHKIWDFSKVFVQLLKDALNHPKYQAKHPIDYYKHTCETSKYICRIVCGMF